MTETINPKPSQDLAREQLWRAGILRWKLDSNQASVYDQFYSTSGIKFVINMARRTGKTWVLCCLALEAALRNRYAEIQYCAATQKQVKNMVTPNMRKILVDCPDELKPSWWAQEQKWVFPEPIGSIIRVAGVDAGHADDLRGTDSTLAIVDEAGYSPSHYVRDIVNSVLLPMTLRTESRIIISSTPAKVPRHYFEVVWKEALETGNAVHRTIYDCPMLKPDQIERCKLESGGDQTTYWKREYLAQHAVDEKLIVFPEFTSDLQRDVIREWQRPLFFDCYTVADMGVKDGTGILFVYYDFKDAKIIVEDEALLRGIDVRTDIFAELVKSKEKLLWNRQDPYFRVVDGEEMLINDLSALHALRFVAADREPKPIPVNELRMLLNSRQIFINPRCKNLITQLECCTWDSRESNQEKFARLDEILGHFELVDCLLYAIRSMRRQHNPYPADRYDITSQFFINQPSQLTPTGDIVKALFKTKN